MEIPREYPIATNPKVSSPSAMALEAVAGVSLYDWESDEATEDIVKHMRKTDGHIVGNSHVVETYLQVG